MRTRVRTEHRKHRLVPRGIRARTTAAAAAVAAIVFGAGLLFMRQQLYDQQMTATYDAAQQQVDSVLTATEANFRLGGDFGTLPYELVGSGGVLISSSAVLKPFETGGRPVMPDPGNGAAQPLYRRWSHSFPHRAGGGPLSGRSLTAIDGTISALNINPRPGGLPADARYRAYVFVIPTAADTAVARIDPYLLFGLPLAVLVVALTAGWAVSRSLHPVEVIRAQTARVTARDPHERVAVPATGDEIEALARTINDTLQRLADASVDQRRFVADAAHELRAPLTNLRAGLEIAQAYPDAADLAATVDQAARSTRRLQLLTDDLLLLARLDAGEPALIRPVDLVALAADVQSDTHGSDVRVELVHRERAIVVDGDRTRLRRLVRNLVDNAVRHATSTVVIDVGLVADRVARLDVGDDGDGIDEAHHDIVFERFTRLDEARTRDAGGVGLGLAIARDIALAHGGELRIVADQLGNGATFRFTMPAGTTQK